MRVDKYDYGHLASLYGIQGKILDTPKEAVHMGSMLGCLAPKEATKKHAHHDHEQFIIIDGEGIFDDGHTIISVTKGDVVHLEPGDYHVLKNEHENKALLFTTVWWAFAKGADIPEKNHSRGSTDKMLILSPPPTPNGELHLGHLAGPYLGADILKRHNTQLNKSVFYLTGSDDNQSYVSLKAHQLNLSTHQVADTFSESIQAIFSDYDMAPDAFYRPLDNINYTQFVQGFFKMLYDRSAIQLKTVAQPFCNTCHRWLFEAHIGGYCPKCQSSCGGGGCETCGFPNDGADIIQAFCKYCKQPPSLSATQKMYFSLQTYAKPLSLYWERLSLPPHVRNLLRELLENGLPEIAITHHGDWGIEAPFVDCPEQTLCSWSEMVPAYLFSLEKNYIHRIPWENIWNNPNNTITLFFGYDNTFFYTVLMPALLLAYDKTIKLPDNLIYNEFYQFEQQKFSTSRSHAVWAKDIIKKASVDSIRYFLAATRPEMEKTQFSYDAFVNLINQDLAVDFSSWIQTLSNKVTHIYHGKCPDGGEWNIEHDEFIEFLHQFIQQSSNAYNPIYFSPATVVRLLRELIYRSKKLSSSATFLKSPLHSKLEYQTSVVLELTALKYYAIVCAPIMPSFAEKIAKALHLPSLCYEKEIRLMAKDTEIKSLEHCVFTPLESVNA